MFSKLKRNALGLLAFTLLTCSIPVIPAEATGKKPVVDINKVKDVNVVDVEWDENSVAPLAIVSVNTENKSWTIGESVKTNAIVCSKNGILYEVRLKDKITDNKSTSLIDGLYDYVIGLITATGEQNIKFFGNPKDLYSLYKSNYDNEATRTTYDGDGKAVSDNVKNTKDTFVSGMFAAVKGVNTINPYWIEVLYETYGGVGTAIAEGNCIVVPSLDDSVETRIYGPDKDLKITCGSMSITISPDSFKTVNADEDSTNDDLVGVCDLADAGLVSSDSTLRNKYANTQYLSTASTAIKELMNDFNDNLSTLTNTSVENNVTVDTSYLSRPETDFNVTYYNASYALNKYILDGSWGGFVTGSFDNFKPSSIFSNTSRLIPVENRDMFLANLWLQQALFTLALPDKQWPDGETYAKPVGTIKGTGTLTDDVIREEAKNASNSVKNGNISTSAQSIALNYGNLVKYASVGFSNTVTIADTSDSNEVDLTAVPNNLVLDGLAETSYKNAGDIEPRIASPLPVPKNIPELNNEKQRETYYNIVYYTLVADSYLTGNYLKYTKGEYQCEVGDSLGKLSEGKTDTELSTVKVSTKQAKFIKAIISLYDGLDYLGINSDYCKSVDKLISYYSICTKFKYNESVDKYSAQGEGEPLKMFFSAADETLSDYYQEGVAVSASFIPLRTNMYDPASMSYIGDENFISEFHYKYGFYRKALYIDTSKASAVDGYITSDLKGTQRIAVLRDLFSPESDIALYVDNNFYNAHVLADKQGYVFDAIRNTEASGIYEDEDNYYEFVDRGELENSLTGYLQNESTTAEEYYTQWSEYYSALFEIDFDNIVKTANINEYSTNIFQGTSNYGEKKFFDQTYDLALWDDTAIDKYLAEEEYSVAQSFAVVSSIYKNTDTFNLINRNAREMSPVFISSPYLAAMSGIERKQFNTIYNYLMLKNLDNNLSYDYKSTLDLDSPIFIDIYGNIITESGLVVIPAASNATLVEPELYTPWTAGFLSLYSGDYKLEKDYNNADNFLYENFSVNDQTGEWILDAKVINGIYMNFTYLPMQSENVMETLVDNFKSSVVKENGLPFGERAYLITEVLRGAPLEDIDYEQEGILANRAVSKTGIAMAYKLDELVKQFLSDTNGNSLVTLPNLAFMDGIEYLALFVFKIMFAVLMISAAIHVYRGCVSGVFGLKFIFKGIADIVLVAIGITLIPQFLDSSYYNANKLLLKDDIAYIAMLNLEKENQGKEIGVGSIIEPQTSTELYIKLDNIEIPWYEMLDDVLLADTFETATQMYKDVFANSAMANQKFVVQKSNGLYVSLKDIMDSSTVGFSLGEQLLYQSITEPNIFSYSCPYYVILDQLIANINVYNMSNNILNYSTQISRDGSVKTTGMISSYFLSDYFMGDNYDVLGLHNLYQDESQKILQANPFADEDMERMRASLWYIDQDVTTTTNIIDELEYYAKNYVNKNKDLLEKVSDETFLKIMALQISLEYNRLMHTDAAQAIEIFNIDSKDLLRLLVGNKTSVFRNSSYSFARYVYEEGGTFSVIAMGCLTAVVWFTSLLKPLFMIIICALLLLSLFCRKLLFQRDSRAYEGYCISMGCFCGCNIVYALMLKLTMSISDFMNMQSSVNIILGLVVQILYILLLLKIIEFQLKDWKNVGFNEYAKTGSTIVDRVSNLTVKLSDSILKKVNPGYANSERKNQGYSNKLRRRRMSGSEILEEMEQRDIDKEVELQNM